MLRTTNGRIAGEQVQANDRGNYDQRFHHLGWNRSGSQARDDQRLDPSRSEAAP